MMRIHRRGFLKKAAVVGGSLLLGGHGSGGFASENRIQLPDRFAMLTDLG